jgi:hypothetical protein
MSGLAEYNSGVTGFTRDTTRKLKNRVLRLVLSIGHGYNDLKGSTKSYMGEKNKISFTFPYYMVYVHKGAGRGYGGIKSGEFTNKFGGKSITSLASKGKMGTGRRVAKPWFNPVIEEAFPQLEQIITDYRGEKMILNIQRILID